ncbi:hypothetical protein GIB67_018628, partial [Kingdonia uniflora]
PCLPTDLRIAKKKGPKPKSEKKKNQNFRSISPISINGGLDFSKASTDYIVKALSLRDSSIPCQSTLSSLSRSYNQTFLLCKLWIWRKLEDVG